MSLVEYVPSFIGGLFVGAWTGFAILALCVAAKDPEPMQVCKPVFRDCDDSIGAWFCSRCGISLSGDERFCPGCGSVVMEDDE